MGKVEVSCPHCNARYQIANQDVGAKAKCKKCQRTFLTMERAEDEPDLSVLESHAQPANEDFVSSVPPLIPASTSPPLVRSQQHSRIRERRSAPALSFELSDSVARTASIILVLLFLICSVGIRVWAVGEVIERANIPEDMHSRFYTLAAIDSVVWITLFFVAIVPLLLAAASVAAAMTPNEPVDAAYLRCAGTMSVPTLLVVALIAILQRGDRQLAIALVIASPVIMFFAAKLMLGQKWLGTLLTGVFAVILFIGAGFVLALVMPGMQKVELSMAGLDDQSLAKASLEASRQQLSARSTARPQPAPRAGLTADPLANEVAPYRARIQEAIREASQSTQEKMTPILEELRKEYRTFPMDQPSAALRNAATELAKLETAVRQAPTETVPDDIFMPITTPLRPPTTQPAEGRTVAFGPVVFSLTDYLHIDLKKLDERQTRLHFKDGYEHHSIWISLLPLDNEKQHRPWIIRPALAEVAKREKLFSLMQSERKPAYFASHGISWTMLHPARGSFDSNSFSYYGRLDDQWITIVAQSRFADDEKFKAIAASLMQSVRMSRVDDKGLDPLDPVFLVQLLESWDYHRASELLRKAGASAVPALQDAVANGGREARRARELIEEITGAPPAPARAAPAQASRGSAPLAVNAEAEIAIVKSGSTFERRDALKRLAAAEPDEHREKVAAALEELLISRDGWHVSNELANALSVWWRPQTVIVLIPLLDEKGDSWKRPGVIKVLSQTKDRRAVYPIARWIIKEPEPVVTALKTMGPVAEDEVVKLLREKNNDARKNAARILETIGTGKSLAELYRAGNDPRDRAAAEAAKLALDVVRERVKAQKAAASQPQK